jgi:branched-chain amino acid transport system substrate-binding protein
MRLLKIFFETCLILFLQVLFVSNGNTKQGLKGSDETVKIGLLIPNLKSMDARHGAEMAIIHANENGGYKGLPFKLAVRSMEGPWGTGSKQAVNLIFEDKVWAIMGSNDGRNAHLVEQAITKARIVFLSAWATDPTLSQAFVPLFFNCVPNDLQQADALIEEIYNKRKISGLAAISENNYDSKLALESFVKKAKNGNKDVPLQFSYDSTTDNFNDLIDKIIKANVNCIILFGKPSGSLKLISRMRQRKMTQPVFGCLSVIDDNNISDRELKYLESVVFVSSGHLLGSKGSAFRNEFQKRYGNNPGAEAAFSYDGMNLIIEAIRDADLDREKIQKSMAKIHYDGVTGPIQFDDKGNRMGAVDLMEFKNGIPVAVEK